MNVISLVFHYFENLLFLVRVCKPLSCYCAELQ